MWLLQRATLQSWYTGPQIESSGTKKLFKTSSEIYEIEKVISEL